MINTFNFLNKLMLSLPKNKKSYTSGCNLLLMAYLFVILLVMGSCSTPEAGWLRGNMHTHTFWSDGDDFPESVVKWYRENGYDFLVMTDHNLILEGEKWRSFPEDHPALRKYMEEYGSGWVEMKPDTAKDGHQIVRLKTLEEFRSKFEKPDEFLLIMGNEISNPHAVHLLAFHQNRVLPVIRGPVEEREKMIAETVSNVDNYGQETGINTHAALAHPNFTWAITAEMMLNTPALRFFEVYNGHPQVNNDGDEFRADTDRIWDIVLANRLSEGGTLLYGLATDDAHNYHGGGAGPGKGWVMVRSDRLAPEAILDALDKGDFYASTGVVLKNISFNGRTLKVEIDQQEGAGYVTEFIGTRVGFDKTSKPTTGSTGEEIPNTSRTYSEEIGEVLAVSQDTKSSYSFSGDELYVRVRITSTKDQVDPNSGKIVGKQKAWVQPHLKRK